MTDEHSKKQKPRPEIDSGRFGSGRDNKNLIGTGGPNFPSHPHTVLSCQNDVFRAHLKLTLTPHLNIVGEPATFTQALEMIRQLKPDLVIAEFAEDQPFVELCRRITMELPMTRVLLCTDIYYATKYHNQLLRAGAHGFCLKNSGIQSIIECLRAFAQGLNYCDPGIDRQVRRVSSTSMPDCALTDRETEVLVRLNMSNAKISTQLDMKPRTVEKHIECILAKLRVPSRASARVKASEMGYVLLPGGEL